MAEDHQVGFRYSWISELAFIGGSSNGKTGAFEALNRGSNPCPPVSQSMSRPDTKPPVLPGDICDLTIWDCALLAQLVEVSVLNTVQCRFESDRGHLRQ
jgi:hypothetical protein